MNSTTLDLVLVPNSIELTGLKIAELASRAMKLEEILAKGTLKENYLRQYILVCQRMEEAAIQALELEGSIKGSVSDVYLRVLMGQPENGQLPKRLYAAFCMPDQAKMCALYLHKLAQTAEGEFRRQLDTAAETYGIAYHKKQVLVVVQDHQATVSGAQVEQMLERSALEGMFRSLPVADTITDNTGKGSFQIFNEHVWKQINASKQGLENGLNPALASNPVNTEVLHGISYRGDKKGYGKPVPLRVVYTDGSEARPFVAFALDHLRGTPIVEGSGVVVLNIGMISARHPEIDKYVEMYWYPNSLVSQSRTSAETDELSYQYSVRMFGELRKSAENCLLYFYQTGFPFALIGFLRALSEELVRSATEEPWLKVVPMLYAGEDKYRQGKPWC